MPGSIPPDSIADRIIRHATRRPEAPAMMWHDRTTTYGELADLARTVGARIEASTPAQAPVAMTSKKSPEAVALILGCLLARRPVLLPSAELAESPLAALLAATGAARLPDPKLLTAAGEWTPVTTSDPSAATARVPDDTAFLLTTSGSTGTPKTVPISHSAASRFTHWAAARFGLDRHTAVLNHAPLNFDLCLLDVWTTLSHGGRVVLVDQDRATQPAHLVGLLRRTPVHLVQGVPLLFQLVTAGATEDDVAALSSVRHVVTTGDALPARAFAPLPRLFPRARFHNVYGCTETNDSFVHDIDPADPMPLGSLPIGRPVEGADACLVDDDGTVLHGPGVGELLVRTPFQTSGYAEPAKDAGVFVAAPPGYDPAGRWYRTGDLARRHPDGTLTLEGRRDHQVKVRGVRVNTSEIEALLRAHPDIEDAVVLALPDPLAGKRLHAVVHHRTGVSLSPLSLRAHLATLLPRVAIPAALNLTDTPLPRTSTGKPDRTALRQQLTHDRPMPGPPRHPDDGA